jgi:tetratricopeptide (TPR) repeat protein
VSVAVNAVAVVAVLLLLASLTCMRNRAYASASAMWADVIEKRPGNTRARLNMGAFLYEARRYEEAERCFKRALSLDPGDVRARYNLGACLLRRGDAAGALAHCRAALEGAAHPEDIVNARIKVGHCLEALDDPTGAADQYSAAVHDVPVPTYEVAQAHYLLGSLLDGESPAEAEKHYRSAVRINPNHARAYNNLGILLVRRGLFREAIACFETACRLAPGYSDARRNLMLATRQRVSSGDAAGD